MVWIPEMVSEMIMRQKQPIRMLQRRDEIITVLSMVWHSFP
jgi:hypothetical protein